MIDELLLLSNRMPEIEHALARLGSAELEAVIARMLEASADPALDLLARISAGNVLGVLGDPRIRPLAPPMCAVPRGSFWMGIPPEEAVAVALRHGIPQAWMLKSSPRHRVELDAFEIARFPVTEAEFHAFLRDTDLPERPAHWPGDAPPAYRANHPVHGVSWHAALLYAEWLGERSGGHYRIPTEAEWEKAARGGDLRTYPWGNDFHALYCNTREGGVGGTTPVGVYPQGAAVCGALDLAGNVEEYTADLYGPYPGASFQDPAFGSYRMTRGGVYSLDADLARCDRRHGAPFAGPTGFRVARSAADEWLGRS
jgi:toxoflavin biosynthesis protein ToxD